MHISGACCDLHATDDQSLQQRVADTEVLAVAREDKEEECN